MDLAKYVSLLADGLFFSRADGLGDDWDITADLTYTNLTDTILTGAAVSRKTTKGVNFTDWEKRGGKILD